MGLRSKGWMRLDNAALIFPAVQKRSWVNTFRLSATLTEQVDPALLQQAVEDLMPRFPSFYQRLGTGFFWYFLEDVRQAPQVRPEYAFPLTHMGIREQRRCCFRVLYHEKRVAVEFFHVLTDGHGGLIYLKNLLARYLFLKEGLQIPCEEEIEDLSAAPRDTELKDAFQRCSGPFAMSRQEADAYRLKGSLDTSGRMHVISGLISTEALKGAAAAENTTVTGFLAALLTDTIGEIQACHIKPKKWRPVKITVPVNLRRVFQTETLRNFSLVLNPGVDPRFKQYSVSELCREYNYQMALELTPEKMAARIAANVSPQQKKCIRLVPLFLKNIIMRGIYRRVGEKKGCINLSNLGAVSLPRVMQAYITRFEMMIGVQLSYPNNCSVASYGGTTCINFIRNIHETELERRFFTRLVERGIPVHIESSEEEKEET